MLTRVLNIVRGIAAIAVAGFSINVALAADAGKFDGLPRLGETIRPTMGPINHVPEDLDPNRLVFGSSMYQDSWPMGLLRTADGKAYLLGVWHNRSGRNSMYWISDVVTEGPKKGFQPDPRSPKPPFKLDYSYEAPKARVHYFSADANVDIGLTATEMTWKHGDLIDLKGQILTPGTYMLIPWVKGELSGVQAWTTQEFVASGTLFGEKVTGTLHIDRSFDRIPYVEGEVNKRFSDYGYAMVFLTQYDDGVTESGIFMCSKDGTRGAFAANNKGEVVFDTHRFNMKTQYAGNDTHVRTDYDVDGKPWETITPPGYSMNSGSSFNPGGPPKINSFGGVTQRKGEKRKIVTSYSSTEGNPDFACAQLK